MQESLSHLIAALRTANRIVMFTGAGISTESGIPDFRSPGGMWSRMPPIEFQDFLARRGEQGQVFRHHHFLPFLHGG